MDYFKEGDFFIWDRGFRDCEDLMHNLVVDICMPLFMRRGQTQFTTAEVNESRLITKVR